MSQEPLLDIARRLREGEDRVSIAEELERIAGRGRGRPLEPPLERGLRKMKRAWVAEAIYRGTFPLNLAGSADREVIELAAGSRARADAAAGSLLNAAEHTVKNSRLDYFKRRPMDRERWEEFSAVLTSALDR